jgi:type I restriction enzyme M protein
MFEFGWTQWAQIVDWLADGGLRADPGRYVGTADVEEDGEPFAKKMARLTATLREQMGEGAQLDKQIRKALTGVGHGW